MAYENDPGTPARPGARSRMPLRVAIAAAALALVGASVGTAFAIGQSTKSDKDTNASNSPSPTPSPPPSPDASDQPTPACTDNCGTDTTNTNNGNNYGGGGGNNNGHTTVSVPKILWQDESYARSQLQGKGLKINVTYVCDNPGSAGKVTRQDPTEGTNVNPNSTVNVDVAGGVKVPDVGGKYKDYAQQLITDAGLVASITWKPTDKVTPDQVISSNPEPGKCVKKGSSVTLNVAKAVSPSTPPSR